MKESLKMSYLILEAEHKCEANGHNMDWQRYNNALADANCRKCNMYCCVTPGFTGITGHATITKCKG